MWAALNIIAEGDGDGEICYIWWIVNNSSQQDLTAAWF